MAATRIYIFGRFERFWHWCQAALIMTMLVTGFEIHGSYAYLGFKKAVQIHSFAAWALIGLWVFAIFWHIISGQWRQYILTTDKALAVMRHYSVGIFKNEPHPFRVTALKKHNPIQRLTYLGILTFVSPMLWISGWFYLFYADWRAWGLEPYLSLQWVAFFHVAAAFLMLAFLVSHLYLITTGHTVGAHLKAMITGWETVDEEHGGGRSSK
jgi:thiosulfate reductase cytochrome b subunit